MVTLSLDELSTEILLKIFKYLEIYDLCNLKQTCKRFHDIIETWAHWFIDNIRLLATNQVHPIITNRSTRLLSPFEKFRVSRNWRLGVYREKSLLPSPVRYIPWLQLDNDCLWVSRGEFIRGYSRNANGIYKEPITCLKGQSRAEVCRFTLKDKCIISGQTDGSMWLWSIDNRRFVFNQENCHESDINSVDIHNDIIASGSRDTLVKIWKKPSDNDCLTLNSTFNLEDRVWSVSLCDDRASFLAAGSSGISSNITLTIFDIDNGKALLRTGTSRFGAGILDLTWENPSILWTSGYDSYIRRWDLRTGNCEQSFEDPCKSTIYCFQYDHYNTIISGTDNNGRVVLWDTRHKNYVQMYFMNCCRRRDKSSPVYGLSFDAEYLFTVTDRNVTILDFSVSKGKFRDYSNLFLKLIKV